MKSSFRIPTKKLFSDLFILYYNDHNEEIFTHQLSIISIRVLSLKLYIGRYMIHQFNIQYRYVLYYYTFIYTSMKLHPFYYSSNNIHTGIYLYILSF